MEQQGAVPQELDGARLDKAAVQVLGITRSMAQALAAVGGITCNGKVCPKSATVRQGDILTADIPQPQPLAAQAQHIPLDIVYEDKHLLVVNKPKGMVVHPAAGNTDGTLVNALLAHCGDSLSGINGVIRPGIVHRIDKDTTGLLIVAKTDAAHSGLAAQLKERSFTREYAAIVHGHFKQPHFSVDAPIGRSTADRKKMCVTQKAARSAITHVEVLEELKGFSYIKCVLETGRTHQIRVHLAYLGHPVAGDVVYGPKKTTIIGTQGQCLHARTIGFVHPVTGEQLFFSSPLPVYFEKLLQKLHC